MKKLYHIKAFDTSPKELWDKVKGEYKGLSFDAKAEFTKANEDNRFKVVFSTDTEDRHLERVYQNFELKAFKANPVFIDSHNYETIENIIGRVEGIKVSDNSLIGEVVFALENPKGMLGYHLAKGGFLNATSIGFIPLEFDDDGNIVKSELLEISAVSVPANPEALFEKIVKEAIKSENVVTGNDEDTETPPAPTEEVNDDKETVEETPKADEKSAPLTPTGGAVAYRAVGRLATEQKQLLVKIAECFKIKSPEEQKRKIFNAVREGLK